MLRRQFLKLQASTIGAAMLGFPPLLAKASPPDLVVVKGSPATATRAAVNALGGISAFVKQG
ncbi:MAG: hypothetical protein IJS50_04605, partial [Desulfovibrio sp.]|nr:hypothetical protein [Desulfovibrio sp.]